MKDCEIRWCGEKDTSLVYVDEIIGDGAWRIGICHECARRLGLGEGDDLPPAYVVKSKLKVGVE